MRFVPVFQPRWPSPLRLRRALACCRAGWLLGLAAGCGGGPTRSNLTVTALTRLGVYRFTERVPGQTPLLLEGQFSVRADSIVLEATPGPCRYDTQGSDAKVLAYECGGVSYRFDRQDPVERLTWSYTAVESVPGPACPRSTRSSERSDACSRAAIVEKSITRSGLLHPTRIR